jgi:hypothetical protein
MAKIVAFQGTFSKGGSNVGSCESITPPQILAGNKVPMDGIDSDFVINGPSGKREWGDASFVLIPSTTQDMIDIRADVVGETIESCVLAVTGGNTYTFSGWYLSAAQNQLNRDPSEPVKLDCVVCVFGDVIVT